MYTAKALERLGLRPAVRNYERGAVIFEPGQPSERVYFLLGGTVSIYKEYGLAEGRAREFTSEILADNEVFGLEAMGYVPDTKPVPSAAASTIHRWSYVARRHGAQALSRCEIASVSARELAGALLRDSSLAADLLEEAMYGVQRREATVELLAHREVLPRLARALLSLGESLGTRSGSQIVVESGLSHGQIAQMTGCTREAVSKAISELRCAGFGEAGTGGICIRNPETLREIAASGAASLDTTAFSISVEPLDIDA